MSETRIPVQKRSLEKKTRMLNIGFQLFCQNGYHRTTTIDIAKQSNISTGALYSYFKNKDEIFVAAFEQYLSESSNLLFEQMNAIPQPFYLPAFIKSWIQIYAEIFASSNQALAQLRIVMAENEKINRHFCDFENEYILGIVRILNNNQFFSDHLPEKIYNSCILIDSLSREKSACRHTGLNAALLEEQVNQMILHLLLS